MIRDAKRLEQKLTRSIPQAVRLRVREAMEKGAQEVVATMRGMAPDWLRDKVNWTWGDAPAGAMVLGNFAGGGDYRITFYVDDYRAAWFEFGTADRVQKSTGRRVGRIVPQPFFWPAWRLNRRRVRSRITRAMNKAIREGVARG